MMTKEELTNKLKSLNKYDEEKINSIVEKYEKSIKSRDERASRKNNYQKIKDTLGVDEFDSIRFYRIRNVSACVVRDKKNSKTKVAFSFYNLDDLHDRCDNLDNHNKDGSNVWNEYMFPILHQITPGRNFDDCINASNNFRDGKYLVEFEGIRSSELSVYEAWTKLSKDKVIPRQYRKWRLEAKIILTKIGNESVLTSDED